MAALDDLQRLGLVVGRIVELEEHAGARAPSFVVHVDLGPQGRRQGTVPRGDYAPADLYGTQVACLLEGDELHILAAHSHARGLVLLRPDREVEDGSPIA